MTQGLRGLRMPAWAPQHPHNCSRIEAAPQVDLVRGRLCTGDGWATQASLSCRRTAQVRGHGSMCDISVLWIAISRKQIHTAERIKDIKSNPGFTYRFSIAPTTPAPTQGVTTSLYNWSVCLYLTVCACELREGFVCIALIFM